ncbi:MAG: DUF4372 domain-containing protein [Candidatus Methylomirabilis oxygeniifera]|nr:MAG: DUF4372 domain-containing protein [Candidatus Methylomirabilis oxyfera]
MFSQILQLFPRLECEQLVRATRAERHAKGFNSWGQFVAMLFCQLGRAHSLQEICQGLQTCEGKLVHLGISAPKRSSLSYANAHRPWETLSAALLPSPGAMSRDGAVRHEVPVQEQARQSGFHDTLGLSACARHADRRKQKRQRKIAPLPHGVRSILSSSWVERAGMTYCHGQRIGSLSARQLALHRGRRLILRAGRFDALAGTWGQSPMTLPKVLDGAAHLTLKSIFEQGEPGLLFYTQDRPEPPPNDLLSPSEVDFSAL